MVQNTRSTVEISSGTLEASKARQNFRSLIDAAVTRGARTTITRNGRPMAAVVPLRDLERLQAMDVKLDQEMAGQMPSKVESSTSLRELHDEPAMDVPFQAEARITPDVPFGHAFLGEMARPYSIANWPPFPSVPSADPLHSRRLADLLQESNTHPGAVKSSPALGQVFEHLLVQLMEVATQRSVAQFGEERRELSQDIVRNFCNVMHDMSSIDKSSVDIFQPMQAKSHMID